MLGIKKIPSSHNIFDQLISVDTKETARYQSTPFPVKIETILHTISPEEIEVDNLFSRASIIDNGKFSREQLVKNANKIS